MIIFKLLLTILILYYGINLFNKCISIVAVSGVNATETRPLHHFLFLNAEGNKYEVWDMGTLINTQWCLNLSFIFFLLVMYINHKLYSQKSIKSIRSCHIIKTRYSIRSKGSKARNSKSKKSLKNLLANLF